VPSWIFTIPVLAGALKVWEEKKNMRGKKEKFKI
jgi:hypothetical protein